MTECLNELAAEALDAVAMEAEPCTSSGPGWEVTRGDVYVKSFSIRNENLQDVFFFGVNAFFKKSADLATIVADAAVTFAFLGLTGAGLLESIERSEAFRLRVPSIISAGFSPGLAVEGIRVEYGGKLVFFLCTCLVPILVLYSWAIDVGRSPKIVIKPANPPYG